MSKFYNDLFRRTHPEPSVCPRMPLWERAAQFSPFAVLTGHAAVLWERARQTEPRRYLSEDQHTELNRRLNELRRRERERPVVRVVYFRPDPRKEGGAMKTVTARVKRLDLGRGVLVLEGEQPISLVNLYQIEGEIFSPGAENVD